MVAYIVNAKQFMNQIKGIIDWCSMHLYVRCQFVALKRSASIFRAVYFALFNRYIRVRYVFLALVACQSRTIRCAWLRWWYTGMRCVKIMVSLFYSARMWLKACDSHLSCCCCCCFYRFVSIGAVLNTFRMNISVNCTQPHWAFEKLCQIASLWPILIARIAILIRPKMVRKRIAK